MAGSSYIDPYPRNEPCTEHTEDIAIICSEGAMCFGEPVLDLVQRTCAKLEDYGDSIQTRESKDAIDLVKQSCPAQDNSPEDQRHAERMLLTHSLWLIDHETLLNDKFWTPLTYQIRNLPDESSVYTWIKGDHEEFESVQSDIDTQFQKINVATSKEDLERWISGYIGFQVNPNGSEKTVIEWSHKVADQIDDIG